MKDMPVWQREYLCQPYQAGKTERLLTALAMAYHLQSEAFDRQHCNARKDGIADLLAGRHEILRMCQLNAERLFRQMYEQHVQLLNLTMGDFRRAIRDADHQFHERARNGWLDRFWAVNGPDGYVWHSRKIPAQRTVAQNRTAKAILKPVGLFIHREDGEVAEVFM
jgi:hypothetical protein